MLLAQDLQQERVAANNGVCGCGYRDGPGLVFSVFHCCIPPLLIPQTGNWEYGLGLVGLGRVLSCSYTEMNWLLDLLFTTQSNKIKYHKVGTGENWFSVRMEAAHPVMGGNKG